MELLFVARCRRMEYVCARDRTRYSAVWMFMSYGIGDWVCLIWMFMSYGIGDWVWYETV
jgi:hypothetical protein